MKVYKKKISSIPYIYLLSLFGLIALIKIFLPSNYFEVSMYFYGFVCIQFLIILFIHWLRYSSRFIIKDNRIIAKSLYKKKEVQFKEIIGYKKVYWQSGYSRPLKYIVLKTNNDFFKNIKLSPSFINFIELQDWIETRFTDLDEAQENKDWNSVLSNEKFGLNTMYRTLFVKKAKKVADTLNFSALLLLPFLYFSSIHLYLSIPALIIPVLAICAIFYFKGIIRTENFAKYKLKVINRKNKNPKVTIDDPSVFTDVFLAIAIPSLILFVIIIRDYNILSNNDLWKKALIASVLIIISILMTTKEFVFNKIKSYVNISMTILFLFGYIYFGILTVNCVFDNSPPIKDTVKVINKTSRISSRQSLSKSYTYILVVKSPKLDKIEKIKVSKNKYENTETGSNVALNIREGLFNMQWVPKIE